MRRALLLLFSRRAFRKLIVFMLLVSLSLAIMVVPLESRSERARIRSLEDALWWATTTVTTVGYGDMVPVTTEGRAIGVLLQMIGVVLFGTLVGSIAYQLNRRHEVYYETRKLQEQVQVSHSQLAKLEKKIDFLILQTGERRQPKSSAPAKHARIES